MDSDPAGLHRRLGVDTVLAGHGEGCKQSLPWDCWTQHVRGHTPIA